jgi:hypothetical protein
VCTKCEDVTVVSEDGINNALLVHGGKFRLSFAACLDNEGSVSQWMTRPHETYFDPCDIKCIEDAAGRLDHPVITD